MRGCVNFEVDISFVVTKWSNTQLKHTKACRGVYIHNGTAWECFDLLIKHTPQTVAAFHVFT